MATYHKQIVMLQRQQLGTKSWGKGRLSEEDLSHCQCGYSRGDWPGPFPNPSHPYNAQLGSCTTQLQVVCPEQCSYMWVCPGGIMIQGAS
jgi:hypothetical protein